MTYWRLPGFLACSILSLSQLKAQIPPAPASPPPSPERTELDPARVVFHFKLLRDGGAIELTARNSSDLAQCEVIRGQAARIAASFAKSDFNLPTVILGENPAGLEAMKRLRDDISYPVESLPQGARILLRSTNPEAIGAARNFLRSQIEARHSGDSLADPPSGRRHPANNLGHDARPTQP